MVLLIGAASSLLGVAYALNEHDVKKLLAYHTVENIGIILLGVGTGLIGIGLNNPFIAALGLMAGLYHLLNHAMFKGLLFLGAGSVLFSTGSRNMDAMGGLIRNMPTTAMCFLIGSLAITAIPPLNGFVSEWFTYQSLFTAAGAGNPLVLILAGIAIVSLAITGALALTCFAKAYGVTFLGAHRSEIAANAKEVPFPMELPMVILAVICVLLGICAPWVEPVMMGIASSLVNVYDFTVIGASLMNPAYATVVSPPLVFILLVVLILLGYGIRGAFSTGGVAKDREPWACGYMPDVLMPVEAFTFSQEVRMFLTPLYTARNAVVGAAGAFTRFFRGIQRGADKAQYWGDIALVDTVSKFVDWFSKIVQKLESGNSRRYIAYIVAGLVFFLFLAVVM